jgi:hypothetical protein
MMNSRARLLSGRKLVSGMWKLFCISLALLVCSWFVHGNRLYKHQFPLKHSAMPGLVLYSVYMGEITYPHLPFLLTSMKWNANVDFVIINVYNPNTTKLENWKALQQEYGPPNLHVEYVTISQFSDVVFEKMKVRVPFDDSWYYKLCDYKPTLPYLFPQFASPEKYKYWGYADLDVVWGNITAFSHLFQGRPYVITGWWHTTGALNMFINEEWTRQLFLTDPKYVPLLQNKTYHNLDEMGIQLDPQYVVDGGDHSMYTLEQAAPEALKWKEATKEDVFNRGKNPQDTLFIGAGEFEWAGHTVWSHGAMKIPGGSPDFPPGRELMFYHVRKTPLEYDDKVRKGIIADMIKYGFLLPSFMPLFSRFACRPKGHSGIEGMTDIYEYKPYDTSCFASRIDTEN